MVNLILWGNMNKLTQAVIGDMQVVLEKVSAGQLDTNVSVDAVSGMAGAIDGLAAVENRTLAGKIIVYPACRNLGLVRLEEMNEKMPDVAKLLNDGLWTREAEQKLLETYKDS